ncbi:MAG: flagellar filament capping protein FliD [Muricomes sp.]
MASINGLSGSTSAGLNSTNSIKGFGGLASGLDRDSLIENMTYATRSKIAAQKQKIQSFQWQQSAMQGITSKLYEFSNKYMSYTSSSNLSSSKLFSRNLVTALGENSKYLSVTGSGTSADTISVLGVKSLAKNAQISSVSTVSDQKLNTSDIANQLSDMVNVDVVSGEAMYVTYGNKTYSVVLSSDYDYSDVDKTVESLNKSLDNVSIGSGRTLADVMKVEVDVDTGKISFKNTDQAGGLLSLSGGTGDILKDLGFMDEGEKFEDLGLARIIITDAGLNAKNNAKLTDNVSLASALSEKEISFSYNGTTKWIKLDKYSEGATIDAVRADIQSKLNTAFGKNRILVGLDPSDSDSNKSSFSFTTKTPAGEDDKSSTLAITSADRGLLGSNSIFGIKSGESNRLNLSAKASESGLNGVDKNLTGKLIIKPGDGTSDPVTLKDSDGNELTWENNTLNEIINAINSTKELGITVSYQSNSDKFVVQSTEQGASGKINLADSLGEVADVLFGDIKNTEVQGQDAVIRVKYAGTDTEMEITRGSNTISVDGLNITVNNTFGYETVLKTNAKGEPLDKDGNVITLNANGEPVDSDGNPLGNDPRVYVTQFAQNTQAVTFDAKVDVDATTAVVKEMIEAFNEALKLVNSEVNQKPDRNYKPLTDEQKAEMSESQIEKWETEAKKGLLFNDTDVRGLADGLRFIIPSNLRAEFQKMGITVSTEYSDNGKLSFNETEFKAALAKDPDAVKNAFTASATKNADGTTNAGGLMTSMKTVMDRYASMTGATKGILVERAGSPYAPTSVLKNSIQKQIDGVNDYIDRLKDKLATEQDRYVSQFTALETLISQMNSQSSYLTSMFNS